MQTFRQKMEPVVVQYNRFLNGGYLTDLLAFKGGSSIGNDYVSKVLLSQAHQRQSQYYKTVSNINNPTLQGLLSDNWPRLILLNAFQRLISAYSVYPALKQRFSMPGTFSHTFTQIMNQGALRGTLKGITMSLLQFNCVLFPSVYLANKTQSGPKRYQKFLTTFTILDGILYPLDTLKNILYADTLSRTGLKNILATTSLKALYSGLWKKLIYNIPLVSAFYFTSQAGSEREAYISWVAAALLYPLHTSKIVHQVGISSLISPHNLLHYKYCYQGVVPFIALNFLVGWQLRALYNNTTVEEILNQSQTQKQ